MLAASSTQNSINYKKISITEIFHNFKKYSKSIMIEFDLHLLAN